MSTIEPYRRQIFEDVLYTFEADGTPRYSLALCGRAKKNYKTTDLALACLYRFLVWPSATGNDGFVLANDEGQANDDLALIKKLIACNPILASEVTVGAKEITRLDGRGVLKILPAKDVAGAHGKTFLFCAYDEIHAYRSHDLFEALAPDPTRRDVLTWITSYAGIRHAPGIPLFDLMLAGKAGDDPRMLFSWYGGDFTTDPSLVEATPEARANPSMASWNNPGYLDQQRKRLPNHKFRRLHLKLPGAPDGAAFDGEAVESAIVRGRRRLAYDIEQRNYHAWVDMSGGSDDDATFGIAHQNRETKRAVQDVLISQTGGTPFDPRAAVKKFIGLCHEYKIKTVVGDAYGGQTFRKDFEAGGITYKVSDLTTAEVYDAFEPMLNAGEVELLDHPKQTEQLLTLVVKNGKIQHLPGDHDDFATAGCGALVLCASGWEMQISDAALRTISDPRSWLTGDEAIRLSHMYWGDQYYRG
jgi:hypothetical protein